MRRDFVFLTHMAVLSFYLFDFQYEVWWINFSLISLAYRGKLLFFLAGEKGFSHKESNSIFQLLGTCDFFH